MGIVAAFDRVLFHNETSRFAVLRMKTADMMIPEDARSPYRYHDHLIRFTAVGYDLPQTDAVKVELTGEWKDGKYGRQFEVTQWREVVPPTLEGIRAYLSSGLLRGIGPRTAEAIVKCFGVRSLDVLENTPEKLLQIRGISEERLEDIKSGYAESKVMRDLLTILAPFKITPNTAMKIYQFFGPNSVGLIRESPYRLCQMPGFGFKRVDAIVQKSGSNQHDPMRIQGAVLYGLEKARDSGGHLYMEATALLKSALSLLNENVTTPAMQVIPQEVENQLEKMILANVVASNKGNIYLPHLYLQESETACLIVQKMMEKVEVPSYLTSVVERVKGQLGITLSKRQYEGVMNAFSHNLTIITGGPGTGKSTILRAVIETFRILNPDGIICLGAPTGKASRRMTETTGIENAQTLHSLLNLHGDESVWQKKPVFLNADLLVVDESSMMDMFLAHQLFTRVRPHTRILMVGDADQLESVGPGDVLHQLIKSELVPVTVLNEIFRQAKDSPIPYNAKCIHDGVTDLCFDDEYFSFTQVKSQEEAAEYICKMYLQEVEKSGVEKVQILSPFRSRGDASTDRLNEKIREAVNPPAPDKPEIARGGMTFRLYDKVMQKKNDSSIPLRDAQGNLISKGVFNGEVGQIRAIRKGIVIIKFDSRYAEYTLDNLEELELAYATTVHKAMGSEYDTVIFPVLLAHKIMLDRNVFYTAITRAKKRVWLVGQKKALFIAISNKKAGRRNTLLGERVQAYYKAQSIKMAAQQRKSLSEIRQAS